MLMSRISFIHTGRVALSGKSSPLFKLRQKTGLAYNLCREALEKHQNDLDQAEAWLKAQELTRGLQKATKVCGRTTKEGLIGIAVQHDHKLATLVELNCETDFVARNQIFKDFLVDLTERVSNDHKKCDRFVIPGQDFVEAFKPDDGELKSIQNEIAPMISKLGENIRIARAMHLKINNESNLSIFGQIHAHASRKTTSQYDISTGRFGAMVALKPQGDSFNTPLESIKTYGNRLCQHIIGYNPTYIELPESIRKHLEDAEKEQLLSKQKQDDVDEHRDAEELSDHEGVTKNHNSRDEWPSMMDQTLIMSDDLTVRDFCKRVGISIVYFNRFECGTEQ